MISSQIVLLLHARIFFTMIHKKYKNYMAVGGLKVITFKLCYAGQNGYFQKKNWLLMIVEMLLNLQN